MVARIIPYRPGTDHGDQSEIADLALPFVVVASPRSLPVLGWPVLGVSRVNQGFPCLLAAVLLSRSLPAFAFLARLGALGGLGWVDGGGDLLVRRVFFAPAGI